MCYIGKLRLYVYAQAQNLASSPSSAAATRPEVLESIDFISIAEHNNGMQIVEVVKSQLYLHLLYQTYDIHCASKNVTLYFRL